MAICRSCGFIFNDEDATHCRRCCAALSEERDDDVSASDAEGEVPALFGPEGLNLSSFDGYEPGDELDDESDAESDDPRDGYDDDLVGAYEELTKSMMANLERDLLSLAAAVEGMQPVVARTLGAILPKQATVDDVTDAMSHVTLTPRKRHRGKTEVEPILVESPSKRHCGKQAPSLEVRRNPKLCQHTDCVFNRKHPGQPAWCPDTLYCQWCDAEVMAASMREPGRCMNVRLALTIFEKVDGRRSTIEIDDDDDVDGRRSTIGRRRRRRRSRRTRRCSRLRYPSFPTTSPAWRRTIAGEWGASSTSGARGYPDGLLLDPYAVGATQRCSRRRSRLRLAVGNSRTACP